MPCTQCACSAKFWMSANTQTLLLPPFDKFLVPYWGFFSRGDVAMLSDKGSRSIYVDRFWGQGLRKYLQGTQGCPELCFGGFGTYGEPNRPLSSIQPSGAIEETGPIFPTVGVTVVSQPPSLRSCLSMFVAKCQTGTMSLVCGDTTSGCLLRNYCILFVEYTCQSPRTLRSLWYGLPTTPHHMGTKWSTKLRVVSLFSCGLCFFAVQPIK